MTNPEDTARFLCSCCQRVMCNDCKSMAGEYEYLTWTRGIEIHGLHEQVEALKRENEQLKRERDTWKEHAFLSLNDLWQVCLESEIYKRVTQPKPTARDKKLNELLKRAEKLLEK